MTEVTFRVSGYQVGDRSNPRHIWGVGLPVDFMARLPEDKQRIKLSSENGRLYVNFNGTGIALHSPNTGAPLLWSSQIGLHHCENIGVPDDIIRAKKITGQWQPTKSRIEVKDIPDFIKRAIESATVPPEVDEEHSPSHFTEDVRQAVMENATGVSSFLRDADTNIDEILENSCAHSSSDSQTTKWFDEMVERGRVKPFGEVVDLTPELADLLLRRNDGNRKIRIIKLNQYISDIDNDRWQLNGESIMITDDGMMNNGQHRCSAVLATNKTIQTFMAFGVSRESRRTVDTGANRGPQDHLSIQGYKNSTALAGITRFVIAYEENGKTTAQYTSHITSSEILDRVKSDSKLEEAAAFVYSSGKIKRIASPSVMGFCYYMFREKDADDAEKFMQQVVQGIGLEAHSPAYVVREKLIEFGGLAREQKIEVLFRGWNAFRKNKPIRAMRIMWDLPELV